MKTAIALLAFAGLLAGAAGPPASAFAQEQGGQEFWQEGEFKEDFMDGTGSGGGPAIVWFPTDLDGVNAVLEGAGHLAIPEPSLYWGGAGWMGIHTGGNVYVALGGGGFGGGTEKERGDRFSRWRLAAGYLAVKGIIPLHRRLFVEGGVQLGGGASHVWVEDVDDGSGIIRVRLRGDRGFVLLRPQLGLDLRLARWVGLLLEGGYTLTSGDWTLEGEHTLVNDPDLDFGDGNGPYLSITVRFGI
jgi:hypothetical protein